jgi:hypothetical protein
VIEGLDRWLAEIETRLGELATQEPAERFRPAAEVIETTGRRRAGLTRNFVGALAKAQHDARVRDLLAEGFRHSRPEVASVLGLGSDAADDDAGGLVLALFHGLLLQVLLDPGLAIEGERMERAQERLLGVLPRG